MFIEDQGSLVSNLLGSSRLRATATLSVGELVGLLLSAAVTLIDFVGNLGGLPALVVNSSLFSASNSLAVFNEGLGLN